MNEEKLREDVLMMNKEIYSNGLVNLTFGNASSINREKNIVVIKPSGVDFDELTPEMMVLVDLNGKILKGGFNPSSDLMTHLELYKASPEINSIIHTHSNYATMFAQAQKPIECLGTTHADFAYGSVPVSRPLFPDEIRNEYEKNTGKAIVDTFIEKDLDFSKIPACLVYSHGPFVWGPNPKKTLENAINLENIAKLNFGTIILGKGSKFQEELLDKHYFRKHGKNAYYGQK